MPTLRLPRLLLTAAIAVLFGALMTAGPAWAHTELSESVPAADSTVADPPSEVILTFTSALEPTAPAEVRVMDPNGDDLVAAPATIDGLEVTVPLNLAVTPGAHQVDYIVTAIDGDDISGDLMFFFEPPAEVQNPPTPAAAPSNATSTPPPTIQPEPSISETPTSPETVAATSATSTSDTSDPATPGPTGSELLRSDGGLVPTGVGVVVGILATVAVGAVLLLRFRDTNQDG